jgi:hypothetical protein
LLLLFGLLCLNYTRMGDSERHRRFAQQQGLPEPSRGIAWLGMLFAPLGGGLIGFAVGHGRGAALAQKGRPS